DAKLSTEARPGSLNNGRIIFVINVPKKSKRPKSINNGKNNPAKRNTANNVCNKSPKIKFPVSSLYIASVPNLNFTITAKTAATILVITQNLFDVNTFWVITRIVAAVFAVMVKFKLGTEAIYSEDTGNLILGDLLHTLFAVFLFAGLFLPLLMDFGLLDFFGTLMTKIMRPLFKLPGRASVDSLASWV